MSKQETNTKSGGPNLRAMQIFVALGIVIGLSLIIAAGWLGHHENRDTPGYSAQLRVSPED
jgi:hypothetical protein